MYVAGLLKFSFGNYLSPKLSALLEERSPKTVRWLLKHMLDEIAKEAMLIRTLLQLVFILALLICYLQISNPLGYEKQRAVIFSRNMKNNCL